MLNGFKGKALYSALTLTLTFNFNAYSEEPPAKLDIDITHTSIEDLLSMNVTSVSKRPEALWGAPAAVHVLTGDDIRRSGATSIPEALRLIPEVDVARIDANKWAVSIRGFNSRSANKLLVLIDGRSVYDPLFSGVLWESKDVMLEDIDRIEIIRGPGGTLWGVNAVNGVINIITKNANATNGGLVTGGGGTEERGFGSFRYGIPISQDNSIRFYGKYLDRDSGFLPQGSDDDSHMGQGGFRFDGKASEQDFLTFQGDYYDGTQGNVNRDTSKDDHTTGGNLVGKWRRALHDDDELSLTFFYDHTELDIPAVLGEIRHTLNGELGYVFHPTSRQKVVTGLRYNYSTDHERNSKVLALDPSNRGDNTYSLFVEDSIDIYLNKVFFTIGSKVGHNDYTGVTLAPSARLSFLPNEHHMAWAAISRASRIPSRLESDFVISLPTGVFRGNPDLDEERLIAYELGYRIRPIESFFVDIATYYNDYDNLVSTEGLTLGNKGHGATHGGGVSATWEPFHWWRLITTYSYLNMNLGLDSDSVGNQASPNVTEGSNPSNQATLQSRADIGSDWEFDATLRYVDSLPAQKVSRYVVGDLRLGYKAWKDGEISIVGQNLFDGRHHFEQRGPTATAVQEGVYGKITLRF